MWHVRRCSELVKGLTKIVYCVLACANHLGEMLIENTPVVLGFHFRFFEGSWGPEGHTFA
jgi:hypothetical protein